VHAVRLVGNVKGKAVAVLGAGTIGLLTLVAARHAGAKKIVSTDQLANKRQMALELGADDVVAAVRGELGESADVVFDCVSHQDTLDSAIKMAVKGGTVGIVGGPRRPAVIDHPVVQEFQIRLQGCATYRSEDFRDAMAIIGSGVFSAERLVTATFPLPKAPEAFAAIDSGREGKILVLADPE
jgi:threonine dehydrogenase-like Zn-dependent dehydrogenase